MSTHSMHYCIALCAMLAVASADLLTPAFTPYGSCDDFNAETLNEGMCYHRYQDSVGLWTIGIGFNLMQSGAQSIMAKCYAKSEDASSMFNQLNQGPNSCSYQGDSSQRISAELAACLLYTELVAEETCVKGILGTQFNSVPTQVRSGMIDMAYNMGCGGLKSFSTMIGLIKQGQYASAAASARGSKWCGQVHGRCDRTTGCIANQTPAGWKPSVLPATSPPAGSTTPPAGSTTPPATSGSSGNGGCVTFKPHMCPGAADCMCTLGDSCGSSSGHKLNAQSVNSTEIFAAKLAKLKAQGSTQTCADAGGTCYKVITGGCPGDATCLGQGEKC